MTTLEGLSEGTMRAIVLGTALGLALVPEGVWGQETITSGKWRASLESDIRNGRDAAGICSDAKIYASSSTDVPFKDWAYGIANQYCAMSEKQQAGDDKPAAAPAAPVPEQPQIVNGITVSLCSHGMPCLGQLKRAMGVWE